MSWKKSAISFFIFAAMLYFSGSSIFAKDAKILEKEKNVELIGKGKTIKGSLTAPPTGTRDITKAELEKWQKWESGKSTGVAESAIAKERGEIELQKLQEKISPNKYEVVYFKGDVNINDGTIKIGNVVEVKKDIVTMRGTSNITFVNSDDKSIEIRISQISEQRSKFALCEMDNALEYITVYYDKASNKTVVDVRIIETKFELYVYDGRDRFSRRPIHGRDDAGDRRGAVHAFLESQY